MSKVKHEIAVMERTSFGKNASRRYRAEGLVPVNVYSAGSKNRSLLVKAGDWEALSRQELHLVYLKGENDTTAALVKEVQFNYLKNCAVHIDFMAVDMDKEIVSELTVHAAGESIGAQRGGVLAQVAHHIEVLCKPDDLPEHLTVDVTKLEVGDSLLGKDIVLPENIKLHSDPEMVIFSVVGQAAEAEAAPEADAE